MQCSVHHDKCTIAYMKSEDLKGRFQKLSSEILDESRSVGWWKIQQVTMHYLHNTAMNIVAMFILFHSVTNSS